jgi:hypothetical protein
MSLPFNNRPCLLVALGIFAASFTALPHVCTGADNFSPLFSEGEPSTLLAERSHALGPFISTDIDGSSTFRALRPFYVTNVDSTTDTSWVCSFYPLFSERSYPGGYRWNILELCIGSKSESALGKPITGFELWPFFWHYDTGVPEESYDAFMPVAGTLRNRLFHKRIDWFAFPLFLRLEQQDHVDTCILWPIFRSREGPQTTGWAAWPLAGHFECTGKYDNTFALWPLFYNDYRTLPPMLGGGRIHRFGVLPFHAFERAPGMDSKTFVWPFFGYTDEIAPRKNYHEIRYLYPFVVVGHGEVKNVDRFLPFYTHETTPTHHKTWYVWPILRMDDMRITTLDIHKDTVLYFLYKNEVQTAPGRDFKARKTQLWPLLGYIDNGTGTRQLQILNPFEPFLGGNDMIRQTWTPFFALYRFERSGDELRHSVLWDLVLYNRNGNTRDFSIGPLFHKKSSDGASSWNVARGLIRRDNTNGKITWSALWGFFGLLKG